MLQFQRLMDRFLQTQEQVMLAYLQGPNIAEPTRVGAGLATIPGNELSPASELAARGAEPPFTQSGQNGHGGPSLHPEREMTPVRAEDHLPENGAVGQALGPHGRAQGPHGQALGPHGQALGPAPTTNMTDAVDMAEPAGQSPADRQPQASDGRAQEPAPTTAQIMERLLQIVGERTGYPPDVLNVDLDIEADLGIDSIKRVEILGTFQRACLPPEQQMTSEVMERLAGLKTLRAIADSITPLAAGDGTSSTPEAAKPSNASHVRDHDPYLTQANGKESGPPADAHAYGLVPVTSNLGITGMNGTTAQGHLPTALPRNDAEVEAGVARFRLTTVDAPGTPRIQDVLDRVDGRLLIITDDERGIALALADALHSRGACVALVRVGQEVGQIGPDLYTANLAIPSQAAELIRTVRRHYERSIAGIVHLLPLRQDSAAGDTGRDLTADQWKDQARIGVKSLLSIVQAAGHDLQGANGDGYVLAAMAMGGTFAIDSSSDDLIRPIQAGVAGLIKTLALERPQVRTKVVDLDGTLSSSRLADVVLAEMAVDDAEVEVGYRDDRRLVPRLWAAPLDQRSLTEPILDSSSVVLMTGGARGITAAVARAFAERFRPQLILVGRSALPSLVEPPETAGLTSPEVLKAAVIERTKQAGQAVVPAAVEAAYARLMQDREIRDTLAALQRAGARVEYIQADVSDAQFFGQVIDDIYRRHGKIDAVIHGAGVIEDQLIEYKDPGSFDRVFDTKVIGALTLARKLRPGTKFVAFFSSVTGRFGNRGQADYAAASEVLNKLAVSLDRQWPGRVVSMMWGPWESGMVSIEIQQRFRERGVGLISVDEGVEAMIRELELGAKGESEVVLGSGPWQTVAAPKPPMAVGHDSTRALRWSGSSLPLIDAAAVSHGMNGTRETTHVLDPTDHRYLLDHQLDGRPVLPAAMALELMAEMAQLVWPDRAVTAIEDFRVLRGVVLERGAKSIRILSHTEPGRSTQPLRVEVQLLDPVDEASCYRATVLMNDRLEHRTVRAPDARSLAGLQPFPMSVESAYDRLLFQGPLFQGIAAIEGINEEGIEAILAPSVPDRCVTGANRDLVGSRWLIDPIVVDSAFQLAILWARTYLDMTPLPAGFRRFQLYALLADPRIHCEFRARPSAGGHILETQYRFKSGDGRVLALLEDMEFGCSRTLNRLAQSVVDEAPEPAR